MGFTESIKTCLQKYIDFNGRASRSEYWWFVLLTFATVFIPVIGWIVRLVLLLPSLAVQVRRLHDMNRSAWWLLLLVPPITIIGGIILLIMSIFPGTPGPDRYGPDPVLTQEGMGGFRYYPPEDPFTPPPPADWQGTGGESAPTDAGRAALTDPPPSSTNPDPGDRQHRYCTQCGMQLPVEARFCNVCGAPIHQS